MVDLNPNPSARRVLNTYAGNRDFGMEASAAADRLLAKITHANGRDLASLKVELQAEGFALDSNGQAFFKGQLVPLGMDRLVVRQLAANLRQIPDAEPAVPAPAKK